MKPKKILFIAMFYPNRAPNQRYRFEQYFSYLEQNGYECHLANLLDAKNDKIFYSSGNVLKKFLIIINSFFKRLKHVYDAKNYDVVFICRETFMMRTGIIENLFSFYKNKIVFDFDDSIWLPNVSAANAKFVFLKSHTTVPGLISNSKAIIAGNQILKNYASQFNSNVFIIPSTIDLNYYTIQQKENKNQVCVGWSGSSTTIQYFKLLEPVLRKLKEKYAEKLSFLVYGDEHYKCESLNISGIKWSSETEVQMLNQIDIGVMPLPDNEWTKGKCAMKALQYMALAKPVVISPIGVNKEIIIENENGFLATTDEEWFVKLDKLIADELLRKRIGDAGKQTIEQEFSTFINKEKYLEVFDFVTKKIEFGD